MEDGSEVLILYPSTTIMEILDALANFFEVTKEELVMSYVFSGVRTQLGPDNIYDFSEKLAKEKQRLIDNAEEFRQPKPPNTST